MECKNQSLYCSNEDNNQEKFKIFNKKSVKNYLLVFFGLIGIILIFSLFSFLSMAPLSIIGSPVGGISVQNPPNQGNGRDQPSIDGLSRIIIWPIWGYFTLPNLLQVMLSFSILIGFMLFIISRYNNENVSNVYVIIAVGIVLIILTNLINGWQQGIVGSITNDVQQGAEIFNDAIQLENLFLFISDYESIQMSLGVHSRTHPPGAVAVFYVLYLLFGTPASIAIAICIISSILSIIFLRGLYRRFFDETTSNYGILLYLLLPAIQIYNLANIYAIVASLLLGFLHFYFHSNIKLKIAGSLFFCYLATFISFMAWFVILCLFLFEVSKSLRKNYSDVSNISKKRTRFKRFVKLSLINLKSLIFIAIGLITVYAIMYIFMGFSYINSFLLAANSEGTGGLAFASPLSYLVTRVADVMDILIFFGPVLIYLFYRGFKLMREERLKTTVNPVIYILPLIAGISLLLVFLTGAYDHGETARAAMYIYPFLLIPVLFFVKKENVSRVEKDILLVVVLSQSVIMQLFGFFIW